MEGRDRNQALSGLRLGTSILCSYLADGHGHCQDSVGSEPTLVLGPIEVPHLLVDAALIQGAQPDEGGGNLPDDIVHDPEDALA